MTLHETKALARGAGIARKMGWFSLGLGLAQILAPRQIARLLRLRDDRATGDAIVGIGLGELAAGLGMLLGPGRRGAADRSSDHVQEVAEAVTINCTPDQAYRMWRSLDNLPRFMTHLETVETIDVRHSHWVARGPGGKRFEWDAEIIDDVPDRRISWRSLDGADVDNSGRVEFEPAPGGRGTEVHLHMRYTAPAGRVGVVIAKLLHREPGQEALSDLRRFKQVIETGEVVHSDASIHRGPHPARPASRRRRKSVAEALAGNERVHAIEVIEMTTTTEVPR